MIRKRIKRLLLGALLLLVCAGIWWQRENIKAGLLSRYSAEELDGRLGENEAIFDKAVEKLPEIKLKTLTEEEREKLQSGEMSESEAVEIMLGASETKPAETESKLSAAAENRPAETLPPGSPVSGEETAPMEKTPPPEEKTEKDETAKSYARIAELIARVYVMRDSYVVQLEGIRASALDSYMALPPEERSDSVKRKFVLQCVDEVSALEKACDAEMDAILAELSGLLKKVDGDLSIADDIKAAYGEEKALKKAYYLNMYL